MIGWLICFRIDLFIGQHTHTHTQNPGFYLVFLEKKRVIDLLKKERKENQGKVCGSQKKKRKKKGPVFYEAGSFNFDRKKEEEEE